MLLHTVLAGTLADSLKPAKGMNVVMALSILTFGASADGSFCTVRLAVAEMLNALVTVMVIV